MGRLTGTAQEAFDKNKRRGEMPWWLPRLGLAMGAVLLVVALWPSGGGGDKVEATGTTVVPVEVPAAGAGSGDASREEVVGGIWQQVVNGDLTSGSDERGTADGSGSPGGSDADDGAVGTGGSVVEGSDAPAGDGSLTEVDRSDGSGRVAVDPGAYPAAVSAVRERFGAAAQVLVPAADSAGPDQVVFRLSVDPDGDGSQGAVVATVTVQRRGPLWRALPLP